MRSRLLLAALPLALGLALPQSDTGGLGRLSFPSSGKAEAQSRFLRGVAALHNFMYEEAADAFREAQRIDPDFALAYWGEAMAFNQTLWLNEDLAEARKVLSRLGPTPEKRAARAGTPKERAWLEAVELLFGAGEKTARAAAHADAMARLYSRWPEDHEVACFYALALLGTVVRSPGLLSESNEEAHQHALVGSPTQQRVAGILEKVLAENPDHPGALHYAIHNYDDPQHAERALPWARRYAKVAPESSHALHMPAHIFLQLGLWDEAAASDASSFEASDSWVRKRGLGIGMRDYHSLSWLLFERLQQGRYREALESLSLMRGAVEATGAARHKGLLSLMRAQYVVETRRWEVLRGQGSFDTSAELFAIGLSSARRGDLEVARLARQELTRRAGREGGRKLDLAIMEKELGAVLELARGAGPAALVSMDEAVALEREMPPPLGPPRPVKPSFELYGELLLELGRPGEAAALFERSLQRWPNRSLSVLGLARARAKAGQPEAARAQYRRLAENWRQADADLPELAELRRVLAERGR